MQIVHSYKIACNERKRFNEVTEAKDKNLTEMFSLEYL
jgi:hypothetical protein